MRHVHKSSSSWTQPRQWLQAAAGCAMIALSGTAALAQSGGDPVYAVTYIDISSNWVAQGAGLLKQYRDASRKEAGNLEFTVLEEVDRPNRFVIMEGWKDQAGFDAHQKSPDTSRFTFVLEAVRNAPPDRHVTHAFATAPARAAPASGALYMVEHIDFMGGDPAIGLAAQPLVKGLAESTQKEPGVVRYDVYQQNGPRVNHYAVVAAWTDPKAFDAHETAPYTKQFRAATVMPVSPSRANLYDQRLYKVVD
jgi:quinol monooxygenase YgiN